jgi:hypothetical protein
MSFDEMFERATGCKPYPYQTRLATDNALPQLLDIPTGLGKTAAVILAWLWRRRWGNGECRMPNAERPEPPATISPARPFEQIRHSTLDTRSSELPATRHSTLV